MLLTAPRVSQPLPSQEASGWTSDDSEGIEVDRLHSMMRMSTVRQLVLLVLTAIAAAYFLYCLLHGTLTTVTLPLPRSALAAPPPPPHSPSVNVWDALGINRSSVGALCHGPRPLPPADALPKALCANSLLFKSQALYTRSAVTLNVVPLR